MDHGSHHHGGPGDAQGPPGAKVKDPVCGMTVTPGSARGGSATHDGREHWFCNPRCRERFIADPARYLEASGPAAASAAPAPLSTAPAGAAPSATPASDYTCPMHPEVARP